MAMRYPGGLIATSPVNAAYPSGVWTQSQTIPYASQNVWQNDQYWRNTTLLLHGDGTNGAQNNTFLDSSSNNFTITRNGNTTQGTFTPYGSNWSNYFDGSSYLSISTASSTLDFGTGDFTIEMWVNPLTQATSYPTIISCASAWSAGAFYIRYSNTGASNKFGIYWNGVGDPFFVSSSTYQENTWHHVAVTRSGSTVTLWVNGASAGTGTSSASLNLALGSGVWVGNNASASCNYKGYISNLRVVKGTAVYTSAFTPPTGPLTAITNTSLLTCQSNRFIDNSSNAFAITVNGSPSVQAFQPFPGPTTWSASVLGGSGYFDGTGDNLSIANNAAFQFGSGDFTVEAWVYAPSNPPGIGSIVSHSDGASASGTQFLVRTEGSNTSVVAAVYSGGTAYVATWSSALPIGQWNHVAFTRSGTSTYLWVNGVQRATASVGSVSLNTTSTALTIGSNASASADNWLGYISGTRITKGAALYTATFTPPTAPPTTTVSSGTVGVLLNFTNAGIFDNAQMNNLETVGDAQISTSVVKYGTGSMAFDGTGDYLLAPSNPNFAFGTGEFTVEMWLYPTASFGSGGVNIVGINSSGGGLFVGGTNKIAWNLFGTGDLVAFSSFTSSYNNVWTHVAYTRSGTTGRLFINGTQQASGTDSTNYTVTTNFAIGAANNGNQAYTGYIDDLRITKGVARYISNFTPPIARMPNQ